MATTSTPYRKRGLDAGVFMGWLSIAVSLLIVVGARGNTDLPSPTTLTEHFGDFCIGIICPLLYTIALIRIGVECEDSSTFPIESLIPAIVLSFSTTTAYCLMSSGWRNGYQQIFCVMGNVLLGIIMEATTGFFRTCTHLIKLLDAGVKLEQKKA